MNEEVFHPPLLSTTFNRNSNKAVIWLAASSMGTKWGLMEGHEAAIWGTNASHGPFRPNGPWGQVLFVQNLSQAAI